MAVWPWYGHGNRPLWKGQNKGRQRLQPDIFANASHCYIPLQCQSDILIMKRFARPTKNKLFKLQILFATIFNCFNCQKTAKKTKQCFSGLVLDSQAMAVPTVRWPYFSISMTFSTYTVCMYVWSEIMIFDDVSRLWGRSKKSIHRINRIYRHFHHIQNLKKIRTATNSSYWTIFPSRGGYYYIK